MIPLERVIARLLMVGTYASVGVLSVGVLVLLAAGRSPLDGGPAFDPRNIPVDLAALRPEGFLWLGLVAVIATPTARVVVALAAFARDAEREMAVVAALILGVIVLSVVLALGAGA